MTLRIHIRELTDSVVARSMASRYAIASGLTPKASSELAIAVSELATNVVKHARTLGIVHLRCSGGLLHVVVDDNGPGLADPQSLFSERVLPLVPGAWREGLGVGGSALLRLLDHVRAENRSTGGLRVHGVKRIAATGHGL